MSRIGKRPIPVADGVQVQYTDREFSVKGPKGEMKMRIHDDVELNTEEGVIQLAPNASRGITPMLGTTWALVRNMVGVGYRASTSSNMLEMNLGYSHPIKYEIPKGVTAKVNANTNIVLESADKQLLGQVCAEIRKYRPPEPYKGKGILFKDERLKRKAGKAGKV